MKFIDAGDFAFEDCAVSVGGSYGGTMNVEIIPIGHRSAASLKDVEAMENELGISCSEGIYGVEMDDGRRFRLEVTHELNEAELELVYFESRAATAS
jgi:hypothetical protein